MKPRKNKPGIVPIYDESLKIAVARDYLTGNLSYGQVAEKYNLPNRDVVRYFVRWYQENHQIQLPQAANLPQVASDQRPEGRQQTDSDKELSDARLKIAALEIMIQIAEQELGIDIRKKSGTKQ
jgi:transposase-like protein